ncbi:hypothetical protein CKM354_000626700 [Cercospora kikuchii]|uniref:Uncharacterized protein n=1 Tax=Cercospora kikuchii TaxID=84275 RepID=A0A9P3FGC1_9PEZI|nr:uncharacterized protein CKM354_000626700 [Cercospora kikuchii]GIZ43022.1 hypothetical protein CKM354_000626700 [Cercospora kikuchii]
MKDLWSCTNETLGDCYFYDTYAPCEFEGDPDIAGIGVVLAFVISVILTFGLVLYGLYFVKGSYPDEMLNNVDKMWITSLNKATKRFRRPTRASLDKKTYREVLLIFSDQQLVLGLAILVVGFSQTATITEYHFSVVSCLGYMAFVVHVASIDILAQDLIKRPERKWWRAIGILLIAVLALVTTLPYLNKYFLTSYGSPVLCIWSNLPGNSTPELIAVNTLYALLSLWAIYGVLAALFPNLLEKRPWVWIIRGIIILTLAPRRAYYASRTRSLGPSSFRTRIWRIVSHIMFFLALCTFVVTELFYSRTFEAIRNWAILLINMIELFKARAASRRKGKIDDENDWGFGQAVPMLLLIIPLLTLFEVYYDVNHRSPPETSSDVSTTLNDETSLVAEGPLTAEPEAIMTDSTSDITSHTAQAPSSRTSAISPDLFDIESRGSIVLRSIHRAGSVAASQRSLEPIASSLHTPDPHTSLSATSDLSHTLNSKCKNPRRYYWNCPATMIEGDSFEDELYDKVGFRLFMQYSMVFIFCGTTVAAVHGWAI